MATRLFTNVEPGEIHVMNYDRSDDLRLTGRDTVSMLLAATTSSLNLNSSIRLSLAPPMIVGIYGA